MRTSATSLCFCRAVVALAILLYVTLSADAAVHYQPLKSFGFQNLVGNQPEGPVIEGSDGALYGTTYGSGNNRAGGVFKINKDGSGYKMLHSFRLTGGDGRITAGSLLEASDGVLYGATGLGGSANYGTVFKLSRDGSGFGIVHSFASGGGEGYYPSAGLVEGSDGALYGVTASGGTSGAGTVFALNTDGGNYRILHSFGGSIDDGRSPRSELVEAERGVLYGTTALGGTNNGGTVFRLNADGGGYSILHTFNRPGGEGYEPLSGLVEGAYGFLYGTTSLGGGGNGTVFKLNHDGSYYGVVYTFAADRSDGAHPWGTLIQGSDAAIYGTTYGGGSDGAGTVFKVNGDGSHHSILHSFSVSGGDAYFPRAGLCKASDGALYGTTQEGGVARMGTVFTIHQDGSQYNVLRSFNFAGGDGYYPTSLIQANDGFLYGTTQEGGANRDGSLFKVKPDGTAYVVLHDFSFFSGRSPAGVAAGSDGAIYGATGQGGTNDAGTLFRLNPDGSDYTLLHLFGSNERDGQHPNDIIEGRDGWLYGATKDGGSNGVGVVFKLEKNGGGYTILHHFGASGGGDAQSPYSGLIESADGTLYGATFYGGSSGYGSVFALRNDGSAYRVLHSFSTSGDDGYNPFARVMEASDGALYGATYFGGSNGCGAIFRIAANGYYTVLHHFAGTSAYQANPFGALVEGRDGALYGTTRNGGANNIGAIFKLNRDGSSYGTLHSFSFPPDGGAGYEPHSGLVRGADGTFYGTTYYGGDASFGVVFRFWPEQTPDMIHVVVAPGAAQASFIGTSGQHYQVERSIDLIHWTALATITMPSGGTYTYDDQQDPGARAYYRAAWVP